jgi:hypothetical protein
LVATFRKYNNSSQGVSTAVVVGTATARNVATTNIATRIKKTWVCFSNCCFMWILCSNRESQFTTGDGTGLGVYLYGKNCNSDAAVVAGARSFYECKLT